MPFLEQGHKRRFKKIDLRPDTSSDKVLEIFDATKTSKGNITGAGNVSFSGTLTVTGAQTFTGATTHSGAVTFSAASTVNGRMDFSSINVAAADTDGGLIKAGTASARIVEDTANMRFININVDNGATSGDNRGIYNRLYLTGAGGGGESLRSFTTVENVAAGTAHGAHLSLNFAASGSITGLGVASRNTLHVPNAAMAAGGTYAATQAEIYSDGASSDPSSVTKMSFLRVVNDGNATGIGKVDDKAYFAEFAGGAIGAGNMIAAKTAAAVTHTLRVNVYGTDYWVMLSNAQ